jgi:molybdopterin adenylyltransferase
MSPQLHGGSADSIGDPAKFGVLTISDRASSGVYEDLSGPAILQFFSEAVQSPWTADYRVIPDEQPLIEQAIIDMVSETGSCLCSPHPWQRRPGACHT